MVQALDKLVDFAVKPKVEAELSPEEIKRQKINARRKKYHLANKEKHNARSRAYYDANAERIKRQKREQYVPVAFR